MSEAQTPTEIADNTMPDLHTINVSSCGKLVLHSKVTSVLDETQNKMQLH